jgi:Mrp family chromosome partitioning ATPase
MPAEQPEQAEQPTRATDEENMADKSVADLAAELEAAGDSGRRVAVIGAARNVGTTLTAVELARSLAQASRVVLVDLAFGSPNLAAFAIDRAGPGMVDLVRGQASFGQIISRDRTSRAHIIAAGRIDAEAAAVLPSKRLRIALEALNQTYDHVVIDVGAMPQSVEALAGLASRAILVTPGMAQDAMATAADRLVTAGFKIVTVYCRTPDLE